MFEDLDIPGNFREELLPLVSALTQLQQEVVEIASGFKQDSFYFIPTLLTLPSRHYTGRALHSHAKSSVSYFTSLIKDAARGEHHASDICRTPIDQLRSVIDYDYDTVRNELAGIKTAVEVSSEDELKEKQEQYRVAQKKRIEEMLPALAQARRSQMH